jgi:HEPN domain-containing protein
VKKATAEWLKSAAMDLDNVAQIIHLEHLTPVAAFHAQQCVEKCFKAVLEEHSKKVPKDHSTLRLYGLAKDLIAVEVDLGVLTDLDDLYIESRYPGELGLLPSGKPTLAEAREFFETAKSIYDQIGRALAGGTSP